MNTENIRMLADVIGVQDHTSANSRHGFNMANYLHPCGTPCCIAGFAAKISEMEEVTKTGIFNDAAEWLGIDLAMANELFCPQVHGLLPAVSMQNGEKREMLHEDITPKMAKKVLMNLAETGIVDWCIAR